ncbi:hypothetical protein B0H11DRAFT_2194885 [Mycena galericulata]|nr:hypothetical protein B0H11DRAFT_2194885 [Mycena galericulata]
MEETLSAPPRKQNDIIRGSSLQHICGVKMQRRSWRNLYQVAWSPEEEYGKEMTQKCASRPRSDTAITEQQQNNGGCGVKLLRSSPKPEGRQPTHAPRTPHPPSGAKSVIARAVGSWGHERSAFPLYPTVRSPPPEPAPSIFPAATILAIESILARTTPSPAPVDPSIAGTVAAPPSSAGIVVLCALVVVAGVEGTGVMVVVAHLCISDTVLRDPSKFPNKHRPLLTTSAHSDREGSTYVLACVDLGLVKTGELIQISPSRRPKNELRSPSGGSPGEANSKVLEED